MIIVDSREKRWEHICRYFSANRIEYKVQKLDVGDYALEGRTGLVIDRKQNLDEVAANLKTSDSGRFWREIRRAKDTQTKLILLVEHGGSIRQISDVQQWKSQYSRITGAQLMKEMYRTHIAYGIEWIFCDKRGTGRRILELLTEGRGDDKHR